MDFYVCWVIILEDSEDVWIIWIIVKDFVNVVVKVVEYEGEWFVVGGIRGDEVIIGEIIVFGEKIWGMFFLYGCFLWLIGVNDGIGGFFIVEKFKVEDIKVGIVKSFWLFVVDYFFFFLVVVEVMVKGFFFGMFLGIFVGVLKVLNEWNWLFLDYEFIRVEEFLIEVWESKL